VLAQSPGASNHDTASGHVSVRVSRDQQDDEAGTIVKSEHTDVSMPPQKVSRSAGSGGRLHALDGLRGIAATVVLFAHAFGFLGPMFQAERSRQPVEDMASPYWWLIHTPLHTLWEGTGAVLVFFVLSGFVLTLPVLAGRVRWVSYYPQRLVRLYLPVWAAVIFAAALLLAFPPDTSSFFQLNPHRELSLVALAKDLTLLLGNGGVNPPLWSLRWEILFSLLLPLYVWVAVRLRRFSWVLAIASVAVFGICAAADIESVMYLSVFMLGVVLATSWESILAVADKVNGSRSATAIWWTLTTVSLFALNGFWLVMLAHPPTWVQNASLALNVIGAGLALLIVGNWPSAKRLFETRPVQWLGKVSFSLYLVHVPILITLFFGMGDEWAWVSVPLGLLLSFAAAALFHRFVEAPSQRISQWTRRTIDSRR
jgi:peptidoglycan/LPS O-acetylase OafA/YrhL